LPLPTPVTKNDMVVCCACVAEVKLSPVNATAAKTANLIADVMKKLLCGGLHPKDSRKTRFARRTWMADRGRASGIMQKGRLRRPSSTATASR
jgi:hypothetical protein